jgi:hypothetical protein
MENKREGNIYDKIVKENIESIIPALMNSVLGFKVLEWVVIKEKLQQTKEKEADVLRIITDPSGRKFILPPLFVVFDCELKIENSLQLFEDRYNQAHPDFQIGVAWFSDCIVRNVQEPCLKYHNHIDDTSFLANCTTQLFLLFLS